MKKCSLDCEFAQEGYCAIQFVYPKVKPEDCDAKTQDDMVCADCQKKDCVCND
jgi:hypothetical protein